MATKGAKAKATPATRKRKRTPSGPRLSAAEQGLRDTLIVTRFAQDWEWERIAAEARISVSAAKRAYKAKVGAMPDLLNMDPIEIVKQILTGLQASVGDFESMAVQYANGHPSAAVGAKKGANDARADIVGLLQAIGTLPHELGTLRHVVELRAVVERIVTVVENFEDRVRGAKLPPAKRKPLLEASGEVRKELEVLAGSAREVGSE